MLDLTAFQELNTINCAGLGEVLFDVYPAGPKLGGAPANFAYHCRQLGLNSLVISAVGHDDLGERARQLLASKFLPALLPTVNYVTGAVNVSVSADGVPAYTFVENTAYDHIPYTEIMASMAPRMQIACFGTLAQRGGETHQTVLKFLDAMTPGARLRIFDINLRRNYYSQEIIENCLQRCEILKCNEDELPVLCSYAGLPASASAQEYCAYLQDRGIYGLIFTEGAKQSTVCLNDDISVLPTPKVQAVDTVGAGDSFTASIVSLLVQGWPLVKAHQTAADIAAYVCTQRGAMPELPAALKAKLEAGA